MLDWFKEHQDLVIWLTGASVILFVATLIIVPVMIVRLPPDYFANKQHRPRPAKPRPAPAHLALRIARNALGILLILVGLIMLLLPGQGLLTILVGVLITEFPGKYRLARWIVSRRRVLAAINWLRTRAGREPLKIEQVATEKDAPSRIATKAS